MSSVSSVSSNDRAMQSLIAALDTTPEEIQARLKVAEPSLISHDAADSIYTTADYSSEEEDDAEEEDVTESFPLPPGSSHSGNSTWNIYTCRQYFHHLNPFHSSRWSSPWSDSSLNEHVFVFVYSLVTVWLVSVCDLLAFLLAELEQLLNIPDVFSVRSMLCVIVFGTQFIYFIDQFTIIQSSHFLNNLF